jgi:STE24 endopeptidase
MRNSPARSSSRQIVLLTALVVDYLVGLVAEGLNLRAMADEPPESLRDLYEGDAYRRSQEYTRARTRLRIAGATLQLALVLGFWALDGFDHLDLALRGLGLGSIPTGLLFIGSLLVGGTLATLPLRLYGIFVIEERFGFNRTTPKTFVLDFLKSFALGVVFGLPILALILLFLEGAGDWGWLACWGVVVTFTLFFSYVFPTWILPLFNRFEPLEEGELRSALASYARSAGFDLEGIFIIDGSRRSSHGNAFFTGFGRNKRIAFYDTLLEKHSASELVAILAHEVGHYRRHHMTKGLVLSILHTGLHFYLLSLALVRPELYAAFGMTEASVYSGLVFFGLLFSPVDRLLSLFLFARLRKHEFEADRFAAETLEKPLALVDSLRKLARENLTNLTPHPFYVLLNYSHPPLARRIDAIRRHAAAA